MKRSKKNRSEFASNGYVDFRGYLVNIGKKKVDLEQHYVVPWELQEDKPKKIVH